MTFSGLFEGKTLFGEPLLFIKPSRGEPPSARLYFPPRELRCVQSARKDCLYELGSDFLLDGDTLRLTPRSRIPYRCAHELRPRPAPADLPPGIRLRGEPETGLLFGEQDFFHRMQAAADYDHGMEWPIPWPRLVSGRLPRARARLEASVPLILGVSGDSISAGANASLRAGVPPFQPPYAELVAASLRERFQAPVILKNRAVGGWTAARGVEDAPALAAERPDLVLVAYGMNDNTHREAGDFAERIRRILHCVREGNPDAEFLLVCGMIGNHEWAPMHPERFPEYRDALWMMAGDGVAVADLTTVWSELLRRKSYHDLTGNGVNHPNDFGHRVYADLILKSLTAGA